MTDKTTFILADTCEETLDDILITKKTITNLMLVVHPEEKSLIDHRDIGKALTFLQELEDQARKQHQK